MRNDFLAYQKRLGVSGIMIFHGSIKQLEVRQLLSAIDGDEEYGIFTLATSDEAGMSLLK